MGHKAEQIGKYSTPAMKRTVKKALRRRRRRFERLDPENAGTKNKHFLKGWSD